MAPKNRDDLLTEQKELEEMFRIKDLPTLHKPEREHDKMHQMMDYWATTSDIQKMGVASTPKPLLDFGALDACPKCKYKTLTGSDPFDRKYEENPRTGMVNPKVTDYLRLTCKNCGYVCRMKCADHDTHAAVIALAKKAEPVKIAEYGTAIPFSTPGVQIQIKKG